MLRKILFLSLVLLTFPALAQEELKCSGMLVNIVNDFLLPQADQRPDNSQSLVPNILFKQLPADFSVRDISASEMDYLTYLTRKITAKPDLSEDDVFDGLVQAKRKYEASINSDGLFIGQRVNETTRNMRKRRDQFELHIKSNDSSGASAVYRSLWESFYVSKSALLKFTRSVKTEEQREDFLESMKGTLLGMVEAPHLRKLKPKVHAFYGVGSLGSVRKFFRSGRDPSLNEVLEILDTIYALSRSEFMYANHRVKEILDSADTSVSVKKTMEEFVDYMNPDILSRRFRLNLMTKADLESYESAEELFRIRPQTLVLWLKHVSEVESWRTPVLLIRAGVQELLIKFTDLLVTNTLKRPVRRLIMLDYNTYVIDRHIERISSVVGASTEDQVDVFLQVLGQGTSETQNQFLETFARLSEDVVVWNRIKKHFKDLSKDEETSRVLVERMDEAEKYSATYGYLSKTYTVSSLDIIVGASLRAATIATLAVNFDLLIEYGKSFLAMFN